MKFHLTDLDELLQQVRNTHPKNYLNEAITSYRAGAYRAALISTWIAVSIDIIEKIQELAVSGDTAVKPIKDRLDKISPTDPASMLAFERDLLEMAHTDLEFISTIEKKHLERLKEDRNICAHPTFSPDGSQFSPLAETVLSYIVQAANYLLIHPPTRGKAIVDRIFNQINDPSFPNDIERAYIVLSSENNLGKTRPSNIRNLSIILLKRLFKDEKGLTSAILEKISSALGAIYRIDPETYNQVIKSKLNLMLTEASEKILKRSIPFFSNRPM